MVKKSSTVMMGDSLATCGRKTRERDEGGKEVGFTISEIYIVDTSRPKWRRESK